MATAPANELVPAAASNAAAAVVLFDQDKFDAFYAKLQADIDAVPVDLTTKKGRDAIASAAAKVRTEKASEATIGRLQRSSEGLLRDKLAESQRANLAEQRVNSLLDEIAALRPDAEKYRERCRRDREHAENARVRKRAARKEAA